MHKDTQKPNETVSKSSKNETVKNSFYEIPYVGNNPELMIAGFSQTPGVSFDSDKQLFMAQTPVFDVKTNYKNCGSLFVFSTEIEYKTNLFFKAMKSLPSNYFCLSLRLNDSTTKNKSLANDLTYSDKAWLLFKPNTLFDHYHFNGTKGNDFSIYFTLDWLNNFIKQATVQDKNTIKLFLDSTADFLISHSLSEITKLEDSQLESLLNISFDNDEVLTNKVDFVFSTFIQALQQENITASHFEVSNLNRVKILEAEGILQSSKFKKFPSISFIANKVGISETKLKQHFKTVYGCTLLKYFQTLQMEEAKALLLTKQFKIAEIADKMGYQNSSKFSAAFKKETGLLPSEFLK